MSYSGANTPSSSPRFWSTDTFQSTEGVENRENLPPPDVISTQPDVVPDENRGVLVQPSPGFAVRLIKPKTKLQLSRDVRRELRNTDTPSILQPVQETLEEENTSSPRIRPINIINISSSKYFDSPSSFVQSAGAPLPNIPISHPISLASRMEASEAETPIVPFPDPPETIMEFSNEETDLPDNIGTFLLESCLTQSWTSVDNQLKILDKTFRFDGKREAIVTAVNTISEETGYTPLMFCVKESRLHDITILTKLGANVNAVSKVGETVLLIATEYAKDDVVQLLVNLGADATLPDETTGRIPLHIACSRKVASWPVVQILLPVSGEEGRLVLDKDGFMPIWRAAEAGNPHVVKELLMALAPEQLSYQNKLQNGDSVMHYVLRQNNSELLRILIEAGGPVDIQNDEGQTLLHIATHTHNDSVLGLLHDYKANPEIADRYQRTALHLAVENGVTNVVETLTEKFKGSIMARTQDGSTLAHLAALTGHPDATIALLKRGVPLNMPNKSGALALHAAARTGHVRVTGILIENGSPVDAKTNENYTALHLAVEYGKPQVTEALLGYGASVDVKGGAAGETPLHIAARVPNGELCAEMLIKSGADVNNTMENGETAMHVAARFGALRMVQILLLEEANPLATSESGETALHVAVRACNYFVVKELIEHVANKQSRNDATNMVNSQNLEGESNLHYATEITTEMAHSEGEDVKIVLLLLDYNADVNIQTKMSSETPLHYCARCGNVDILMAIIKHQGPGRLQVALNRQAKNGWSPLLTASEHGHEEIVRQLLRNNARVDVFDEQGKAALHIAAENGHLDIVDLLLHHKAFVNAKSKLGLTPTHLAAMKGWTEIVQVLVEKYDAAIDALSLAKRTPLHMAAQYGKLEICDVLLRMKADPNAKDQKGLTPLHLAAENDHPLIVELFLKAQADSNPMTMVDENGYTVAHIAAQNGSDEVVRLLMSFDKQQVITAKIRTDDSTALHLAAAGGHAEVVKVLVEGGASPVEENADGMTPLHLAAKFGYLSVLEILKELISLKVSSVKTGLSALHLAAFYGQVEFARELLTTVPATIVSDQPTINNAIVKEIGGEPGLTPLHLASHSGQENMVRLLLNYPGVQVDAAADISGLIPLHLAALNGHLPIVGLLLSKSSAQLDTRDKKGRNALMLAGANGHEEMASLLIGQGADVASEDNNGWTALHHAAKAGYLKVVKVLVEAGASPISESSDGKIPLCYAANAQKTDVLTYLILKDHDCFKLLEDRAFLFDLMNCGKLFHQKALEDFITTSPSPVEIALKLSRFYQDQSLREKELERDSILASKFCETLGNDLLTISCNRFSPALVLRAIDQNNKSLMDILVEGSHKEVVAEPSVQRFLSDVWYGNQEWSDGKSTMMFLAFLLFPPFWLVMSLPVGRYSEIPFMKLMSSIVSHLFFIVVLILVFLSPFENLYDRKDPLPEWAEWLLLVWLIGKVIDEFFTAEERSGLGWIRIIVLAFCALGIIMHGVAFAFTGTTETILLYIRNQLFATAGLFACIQIVNYLSFHYMFGPMGIIIQDLVKDLMRFLVVLSLFMIGFSFSSSAMFLDTQQPNMTESGYYYPHSVIIDMASDPLVSFQYLYFALFGLVDPTHMPDAPNSPPFSSTLIKILVMVFLMVTMVVLINLLIAMLSDTYQRIQARSDLEWKFGRAKLIINTQKSAISPPPLNVITVSATYAYRGVQKCMNMRRGGGSGSTEELAPSGKTSREGSHVLTWRKSFQDSGEGGASTHFKKVPVKRLVDVIDWESVVSAYRGGSATDYELENTAVLLGIEHEI